MIFNSILSRRGRRIALVLALATGISAPSMGYAQSQAEAQLNVRIQQLEEQLRNMTGQIEGLQFQLTQMQTLLERQTEDNEFRFQQLEGGGAAAGGAGGKTEAAPQAGGVTPSGELPQDPVSGEVMAPVAPTDIPEQGVVPLPGELEFDPTFDGSNGAPMDGMGDSGDPLLGTGNGAEGVPLGGPTAQQAAPGQPLDLSLNPNAQASTSDAQAQFKAGYDAVLVGDYALAEEQFRQFIAIYPDDPNVPDATNWLGDALIQRGANEEAADVLLTGYQKYPDSTRAPDLLLKLGVALGGAGETETACRTFDEVGKRYTNLTSAFTARLAAEKAKAQCPTG